MLKFGLIGFPLLHSFSKKYFEEKFKILNLTGYSYDVFPLENINQFPELLKKEKDLRGLSVTIPHKESVIPFLDELDITAKEIGAVNCIKITNGKLIGYNTDAFGFKQSVRPFLDSNHTKALIFGTGGSSKAVAYILKNLGIDFWFVTRKLPVNFALHTVPSLDTEYKIQDKIFTYEELTEQIISSCKLLVNCTPVGMSPNNDNCVSIPYSAITPEHLVYDLIYNPAETLFLKKAKEQGALVSNGYNMLCFQADEAWRIWNE